MDQVIAESAVRAMDLQERIQYLIGLACIYRGCSRRTLASSLGRHASRLVPETATPRVEFILGLAEALDWEPEQVLEILDLRPIEPPPPESRTFEEIRAAVRSASARGDARTMLDEASRLRLVARNEEERAKAHGWEGLAKLAMGRFAPAITCWRALVRCDVDPAIELGGYANIGSALHSLGYHGEAISMTDRIVRVGDDDGIDRGTIAFAWYIQGAALRQRLLRNPRCGLGSITDARHALVEAIRRYDIHLKASNRVDTIGIRHTCEAEVLCCDVMTGTISATDALDRITTKLDDVVDLSGPMDLNLLESYGWWCSIGCEVTNMLDALPDRSRMLGIFTNKGYEIAERIGCWSLYERMYTHESSHRHLVHGITGIDTPPMIDAEDIRVIVGLMGRFPGFLRTGWDLIMRAPIVDSAL